MKKLTVSELKKQLAKKSKKELIQEISTLYQKFPHVKDYYDIRESNMNEVIKKYEHLIEKEFVEGKTRGLPKARLSVARKAVNEFKKLTKDPELIAKIMLTYVESVSWFSSEFGPDAENYYTSPEDMFEKVLDMLRKNDLLDKFEPRAYQIVENATDSWGHQDSLQERYEDVYGEFKA